MTMLAYYSDPEIKAKYLARVNAHARADRLVRGTGWKNGKGCAIGCTLEAYEHVRYETELGIPETIARLEDAIFEGLPEKDAMEWPARFLDAISPGADLGLVWPRFVIWLLADPGDGMIRFAQPSDITALKKVVTLYQNRINGQPFDERAAVRAVALAGASVVQSGQNGWPARSVMWAARSVMWAGQSVAASVQAAAQAARWAEEVTAAAARAESVAYQKQSEKLLSLLRMDWCDEKITVRHGWRR